MEQDKMLFDEGQILQFAEGWRRGGGGGGSMQMPKCKN